MADWKRPLFIGIGWGLGTVVGVALVVGGFLWYRSRPKPPVTPLALSSESSVISVPRGITGLEVGMTPQQIGQLFTIKESEDPVVTLLKRYGRPDQAGVAPGKMKQSRNAFLVSRRAQASSRTLSPPPMLAQLTISSIKLGCTTTKLS